MTTGQCIGCLGSGRCWICLGTGFSDTEQQSGTCSRCSGTRLCHLCDATSRSLTARALQRRVLVVDDEPQTLTLVELWLDDDPRCETVDTATTGEAAFLALATGDPDTIVVDHNIGPHTSDEYLPGFRSAAPDARIVVHTGNPDAAATAGVLRRGADLVVEKGRVTLDELADIALNPTVRTPRAG